MKYIVLGDIHGNYYALESVLMNAIDMYGDEISGFIFTGDYVGDFPDGSKVVDLMQKFASKYTTYVIKGNRETGQVVSYLNAKKEGKEPNWSLDTTMGSALVSCRELKPNQLEYLASLPDTIVVRTEGAKPIFVKHKMPLTEEELEIVKKENMIVLTAHTHEVHSEIKDGIYLVNSGAVGLVDEGIKGASYGVLDSDQFGNWKFSVKTVDYDYDKTIESLRNNDDLYNRCCGWGKALELSVLTGINCTALYSFEAKRLAKVIYDAQEKGEKPNIDIMNDEVSIFGQGRYGNTNYDGNVLRDYYVEEKDDAYVLKYDNVITSDGTLNKTSINPTKEIYALALDNVKKIAKSATKETVYTGRHMK